MPTIALRGLAVLFLVPSLSWGDPSVLVSVTTPRGAPLGTPGCAVIAIREGPAQASWEVTRTLLTAAGDSLRPEMLKSRGSRGEIVLSSLPRRPWRVARVGLALSASGLACSEEAETVLDNEIMSRWASPDEDRAPPTLWPELVERGQTTTAMWWAGQVARSLDPLNRRFPLCEPVTFAPPVDRYLHPEGASLLVMDFVSGRQFLAFDALSDMRAIDLEPRWSPDGRWLAFHTHRAYANIWVGDRPYAGQEDRRTQDLWIWDSVTDRAREIVPRGYPACMGDVHRPFPPSWAPNSRLLVFAHRDTDPGNDLNRREQLWCADAVAGTAYPLPQWIRNVTRSPLWLPDSSGFVVFGVVDDVYGYHLISLSDQTARLLCSMNPRTAILPSHWAISPDQKWLAIWRSRRLYAVDLTAPSPLPVRVAQLSPEFVVEATAWFTSGEEVAR